MFDLVELGVRLGEVIEQAARCRDNDVDARTKRVLLRTHANAAENRGTGERRVHGDFLELLDDLCRELTRRRHDEGARGAARSLEQLVKDWKKERGGLAASRHRAGEHVATFHRGGNRVDLNRSGTGEAELFDAAEQVAVQLERGKGHVAKRSDVQYKPTFPLTDAMSFAES